MTAKTWRLGRLFGPDGRTVILPVDHGLPLGEVSGLQDPIDLLSSFRGVPLDGVLMSYGLGSHTVPLFASRNAPARVLTADNFLEDAPSGLQYDMLIRPSIAIREGYDAMKVIIFWDQPASHRMRMMGLIAELVAEAHQLEMPIMVEPTSLHGALTDMALGDAVRLSFELGADIIKIPFPDSMQTLNRWTRSYPIPFVMLGGSQVKSFQETIDAVELAINTGARGVVMGRNIWQRPRDEALAMMRHIGAIVHPTLAKGGQSWH